MNVAYITMVFPAITETFACADVRALRASDVDVSVYTLRSLRPRGLEEPRGPFRFQARVRAAKQMLAERGLEGLVVDYSTAAAVLRGLWHAAHHPATVIDLVSWILRLNWRNPRHLVKSLLLVPRSLDILRLLRAAQPDVVHLFWGHYPAIVGYLVHRHLPGTVLSMFLGAYDLLSRLACSRPVARATDVVWTHAQNNVPILESLGVPRRRIRVAYRGIDLAAFQHEHRQTIARRLVTAGRLSRGKGVDRVLEVVARLGPSQPDTSLVVLGDGPERARLTTMAQRLGIAGAVTFRGYVSHDEVLADLATAAVFLFLSETECLPNAVKEAMASGCVCIVSETAGIEELITDGIHGFLVRPRDVEQAAERVDYVFRYPDHARAMAAAARAQIAAKFDVTRSMATYRDHWQDLVRARRQASEVPRVHDVVLRTS
jgi:glycosyltransferase involved in cell wall biosynthesis